MLDVFGGGHLGRFGVACCGVLPEVFESRASSSVNSKQTDHHEFAFSARSMLRGPGCGWADGGECTYSSVAFISGQDCGEQNSVMDP